ncbi:MAG: RNA-binding domain-containing protein [Candidatus Hydrothermarchaeales archaeon]
MKVLNAEIETFVHATEDLDKVLGSLKNLIPFEFTYETKKTFGHFKNPILVINTKIRGKDLRTFIKYLNANLKERDKERILRELEGRLDDRGRLFIRLDKMEAYRGTLTLGRGIQVTLQVTSYPFDRKKILEELKKGAFMR